MFLHELRGAFHELGQAFSAIVDKRRQLLSVGGAEVFNTVGQPVLDELRGIGHRRVGVIRRAGDAGELVVHLCGNLVEILNTLGHQGVGGLCGLLGAPQVHECLGVVVGIFIQDLQHVAQAGPAGHQLAEGLAGLFLQDLCHIAGGLAQLVHHAGNVGRGLRRGDTAAGQLHISRGDILQIDAVGAAGGDRLAHGAGQLVHAGFAQILRLDQDVGDAADLGLLHAVGVQGRGQDVRRVGQRREACNGQPVCFVHKANGVGSVNRAGNSLIHGLRDVGGRHACGRGQIQDAFLHGLRAHHVGVHDGLRLCKGRFERIGIVDGCLCRRDQRSCSSSCAEGYGTESSFASGPCFVR